MDTDSSSLPQPQYRSSRKTTVLPEVECFIHLLVVIKLVDNDHFDKVL